MDRALDTVRRRSPERYAGLVEHLRRAPGHYAVGDERFTVDVAGDRVSVRGGWQGDARARIETTAAAVLALFDGTRSLEQVLADESVVVHAGGDVLLDLNAAVSVFAAEAVGTTAYVRLFEEFRVWATRR